MTMAMAQTATTSEHAPEGYKLLESPFGGFYFEAGEYGSEDYRSRRNALKAAHAHQRQETTQA
jgi:hypothetical protein